jgi:hypothetical protein
MRPRIYDAIATLLVAAVVVPYIGFLVAGSMPFIKDERGMSATGLVLGIIAFAVAWRRWSGGRLTMVEQVLGWVSLAVGIVALAFAETGAAVVLLAVFMATIVLTWAVEMLHHAGLILVPTTPGTPLAPTHG